MNDRRRLAPSFLLSFALGAGLLGGLIWYAGVWSFLANTRLLDLLVKGGIVSLRDDQPAFVRGVPNLEDYWKSQDPIDWPLVFVAAGIFVLFWWIKAFQYGGFARFAGIGGGFAHHGRSYFLGQGLNRVLPFNLGNVAFAHELAGEGGSIRAASLAVFLGEVSIVFEIAIFALYGLFDLGWGVWAAQLFWPLVILAACYWFVRPSRRHPNANVLHGTVRDAAQALRALAQRPRTLGKLALLGLLAFGLEDIAAYVIAMAFTGDRVIIDVPFGVLLMGVCGSYIARLIPVTPGGIGQFEWGFALALYWGGLGLPECVTLAVLDNLLRYVVGSLFMGSIYLGYGVRTRLDQIAESFAAGEPGT